MKDKVISFVTAKLARKKGFPQQEYACYRSSGKLTNYSSEAHGVYLADNNRVNPFHDFECVAPTQSLLQRWLREKHELEVNPSSCHYCSTGSPRDDNIMINYGYFIQVTKEQRNTPSNSGWFTFEEAFEAGLIEALKLIK